MGSAARQSPARSVQSSLRGEDGWTLIELLTAMALTVVIMAASGTLLYSMQKTSNADTEDSYSQMEAQSSIDRMVRELSQAIDVTTTGDNQMTVTLLDGSTLSYKCDQTDPTDTASPATLKACFRITAAAGATLPTSGTDARIYHVANPSSKPVFTYTYTTVDDSLDDGDELTEPGNTPDPLPPVYVKVHLEFPAKGVAKAGRARTIVLETGFEMRNIRYNQTGGVAG